MCEGIEVFSWFVWKYAKVIGQVRASFGTEARPAGSLLAPPSLLYGYSLAIQMMLEEIFISFVIS